MNKNLFTYKKSGVNIKAADKFIDFISKNSSKKRGKKKFNNNMEDLDQFQISLKILKIQK